MVPRICDIPFPLVSPSRFAPPAQPNRPSTGSRLTGMSTEQRRLDEGSVGCARRYADGRRAGTSRELHITAKELKESGDEKSLLFSTAQARSGWPR